MCGSSDCIVFLIKLSFSIFVLFRIVDPETAVNMLHKALPQVPPLGVPNRPPMGGVMPPVGVPPMIPPMSGAPPIAGVPPVSMPPMAGIRPMASRPDIPDPMRMDGHPPFNPDNRPPFGDDRRDPRNRDPRERGTNGMPNVRNPPPMGPGGPGGPGMPPPQLPPHLAGADPEKAQLIMQVLQLTDEQIAMLPPQQRESIMVLKEQINQGPR